MSEVDRLLEGLDDPAKRTRRQAAEALGRLAAADGALRARLAAALADGDPPRRYAVAYALFVAGDRTERLWAALSEALGSGDGDLRWAAARLVIALEFDEATSRLLDEVASRNAERRKMALYCLRERRARGDAVEGAVAAALADPEPGVRLAGMSALAALARDPADAADAIARLVDDREPGVRRAAAATLGKVGVATPIVRAALARAAATTDEALARAARGALERLSAPA